MIKKLCILRVLCGKKKIGELEKLEYILFMNNSCLIHGNSCYKKNKSKSQCTIATAKVQRNYNCYNVYFNGCLP